MSGAGPHAEGGTFVGDAAMTSDIHPHTAAKVNVGEWQVTWLPGMTLTRSQALTAMVVGDVLARYGTEPKALPRHYLLAMGHWASELGLLTSEMLTMFEAASLH